MSADRHDGTTSASTGPGTMLTMDILEARVDLFAHPLADGAWELNCPEDLRPPGSRGRRVLVVPKGELDRWARELRSLGADVRVEPRNPERPEFSGTLTLKVDGAAE